MRGLISIFCTCVIICVFFFSQFSIERKMGQLVGGVSELVHAQQEDVLVIKRNVKEELDKFGSYMTIATKAAESAEEASKQATVAAKEATDAAKQSESVARRTNATVESKVETSSDKKQVIKKEQKLDKAIKQYKSGKPPWIPW
jgi:hypothetical protein